MPQYATIQDFERAFTEEEAVALSNLNKPEATVVDAEVLNEALVNASAEIDSYLRARYSLPFAIVPQELVPHCLSISRYRLTSYDPSDDVRQRYEDSVRWLEQVARGLAILDVPAPEQEVVQGVGMPQYCAPGRIFTHSSLGGY